VADEQGLAWHVDCETADRRSLVRGTLTAVLVLIVLFVGFSLGRASDRDEMAITAKVSSAEHESQEGYFSVGPDTTLIAKPGSELHRFLVRENGRTVRIVVTAIDGKQLSRLDR
jgi:hypothetical protein